MNAEILKTYSTSLSHEGVLWKRLIVGYPDLRIIAFLRLPIRIE